MLVKDIMTRQVVAIGPDVPIADANALMEQRNIRHFPIMEDSRLIGIISDRDIRLVGSEHPKAPEGVRLKDSVRKIMIAEVITAHPLEPIEEAAKVLQLEKIGAMPVVQDGELLGIVTAIDFLDALTRMTGVYQASSRLEVELGNQPSELAHLLRYIAEDNIGVSSIMTTRSDPEVLNFVLRVNTMHGRQLAARLREAGFHVVWPVEKL
jgi:acetoin utilization protein AcuB